MYVGNVILNKCFEDFFTQGNYSFRRFNCNRELILNCWHSYKKQCLTIFSLIFGTKRLKTGDLRIVGISRKCNRLTTLNVLCHNF